MGGKKKKGLSTKLAKMSDEERARYLQHRAAIEEEARRRKEQLISTFVKIKLKKEEGFTRLNIAKINEHWHQILRKIKITSLKTEMEELSLWITKLVDIKNSIIIRLMKEIEESEEQYQINLKGHLSQIEKYLDIFYERENYFCDNFEKLYEERRSDANAEKDMLIKKGLEEEQHLKTIIYGMECIFQNYIKKIKEFRTSVSDEYTICMRYDEEIMVKTYYDKMTATWQEINRTLREYIARVGKRRNHYIELIYLDQRNIVERLANDRKIDRLTKLLQKLEIEQEELENKTNIQLKQLCDVKLLLNKQARELKNEIASSIKKDDKLIKFMTSVSNEAIKNLEKILEKGGHIKNFVTCCSRLQTEKDKLDYLDRFNGKFLDYEIETEESKLKSSAKSEEDSSDESKAEIKLSESPKKSEDLPECLSQNFDVLMKMEGLLWNCNKAEIETINLKQELDLLTDENATKKAIIKRMLYDAALEIPPLEPPEFPIYTQLLKIEENFIKTNMKILLQIQNIHDPTNIIIEFQGDLWDLEDLHLRLLDYMPNTNII